MVLYADGEGKYQLEYDELWSRLVPVSGPASSQKGELVRVIGRLASECYRNGSINWENGYSKMLDWLEATLLSNLDLSESIRTQIQRDCDSLRRRAETGEYKYKGEDEYDRLTDAVVEACRQMDDAVLVEQDRPYSF